MPTPTKPAAVLEGEKRSHRTKEELSRRKIAEQALLSQTKIREAPAVRASPAAHKEFRRLVKLLEKIEKDDALYQGPINRYCQLSAECGEMEEKREVFFRGIAQLEAQYEETGGGGMTASEYFACLGRMQSQVIALDKQVMAKRRMLLDIERECLMTIASALRSVPKRQTEDPEGDPLEAMMKARMEGGGPNV